MKKTDVAASVAFWAMQGEEAMKWAHSSLDGLSSADFQQRGATVAKRVRWIEEMGLFAAQFKKPLPLLLLAGLFFSAVLGEFVNAAIIMGILLLSGILGFMQERNAGRAMEALRKMIQSKATVRRGGMVEEIALESVVEGDILLLKAGDMIAADSLLLELEDLYVNEAVLTGESFPAEKKLGVLPSETPLLSRSNAVFAGTSVISGTATALAMATGVHSQLGGIAQEIGGMQQQTAFERGLSAFGMLLMRVALIMSGLILVLNLGLGKPALDSLLFALALSLGLTPEILPAIVTITLASGARRLAEKKVIVKKLAAIQNFGAIDILCSDKTGTLTEGTVQVHACVDTEGAQSAQVELYALLNSSYETGYANPMDEAIRSQLNADIRAFSKLDEVPYDFIRKRLSVVAANNGARLMITKGAVKNIWEVCSRVQRPDGTLTPIADFIESLQQRFEAFSTTGFRTIGLAYKDVSDDPVITKEDESDLIFLGFILLFDPPRAGVAELVQALQRQKVQLKIITGDNARIAQTTARQIGLPAPRIATGTDLQAMSDDAMTQQVQEIDIFAEIEPSQKERIVRALQRKGHVVGYIGDGINDASALKAADVGISVQNAVDVAKESADMILLEKGLEVILDGISEGRKTYLNTLKYIFITISANFGNMFSMAGASVLLRFIPLLPAQILLTNLLTDLPAFAIASDQVDREMLAKPRRWDNRLIRQFMIVFGLESSLFDFLTFAVLLFFFHASPTVFRTGWFVETVLTEIGILLVIRTRRPFFQSAASRLLLGASLGVVVLVLLLPYLPFAGWIGFTPLPLSVLATMLGIALLYTFTGEWTKQWLFRKMNY